MLKTLSSIRRSSKRGDTQSKSQVASPTPTMTPSGPVEAFLVGAEFALAAVALDGLRAGALPGLRPRGLDDGREDERDGGRAGGREGRRGAIWAHRIILP